VSPAVPAPGRALRVVLADDAALIREAIAGVLERAGIAVVAQVGDADALARAVARTSPDVAVIDIRMPPSHRLEGLEAAIRLRSERPTTGIMLLSQYCETHHLSKLLDGKASGVGYLLKERVSGPADFVDAVRLVADGGCAVDPEVVALMLRGRRRQELIDGLSEREREVLALMAQGRSNRAIGERMVVSPKTVETHVRNIFTRLGLHPEDDDHRRVLAVLTYLDEARRRNTSAADRSALARKPQAPQERGRLP
jgi:DNA-binding NarL/FixJ family response regulator